MAIMILSKSWQFTVMLSDEPWWWLSQRGSSWLRYDHRGWRPAMRFQHHEVLPWSNDWWIMGLYQGYTKVWWWLRLRDTNHQQSKTQPSATDLLLRDARNCRCAASERCQRLPREGSILGARRSSTMCWSHENAIFFGCCLGFIGSWVILRLVMLASVSISSECDQIQEYN